jgi:ParB family chromosome partitioning protein
MAELRSVDPRILQPNPDNPRHTPVSPAMDEQLLASIKAIGIIQPPIVVEKDGALVINAGNRRVKQAIKADFATIDVLVCDADEARDLMRSLAENLIRASMNSVDIWRGIDTLEKKGWNEQAIADALALPLRTVKRLKLLAHLHSPMLDAIAAGSAPSEDQLRTIAAASRDEQAQVWKKHKPKKGYEASWYEIARALAKRRIPFSAAKFGDDLAQAYGVVWEDDLFAPADEDGRYTTNVDGFFGAQQEWLQNNLPERGTLLPQDEYGRPQLPKKAENVYGTPGKNDRIGHYLDPYSGAVKTLVYRLRDSRKAKTGNEPAGTAPDPGAPQPKTRPDVTQKGLAMIGDFRTDALHQALRESRIEDTTLLGLLVLALAGKNVSVQSGADMSPFDRERIAATITEGGVLTSDFGLIRTAARSMLVAALSCRDNMSNSGPGARIAGEAIGASLYLPTMATDEFLSCLSRQALEKAATTEGVRPEVRVRDARGRFIERFTDTRYVYPGALFQVTSEEIATEAAAAPSHFVRWPSSVTNDGSDGDAETGEDMASDADALAGSAIADMPPVD